MVAALWRTACLFSSGYPLEASDLKNGKDKHKPNFSYHLHTDERFGLLESATSIAYTCPIDPYLVVIAFNRLSAHAPLIEARAVRMVYY
jgi:hypothetical protein